MELARGTIEERPWALTLARFARRSASGQITLLDGDGKRYAIAFDRGLIVAARSPMTADSVARVALTNRLATSAQVAEVKRRMTERPDCDEIEMLAAVARLAPAQIHKLRCESILRAAARTFAVEIGEYVFEDTSCLPVAGCDVDFRAVVYHGVRMHLSDQRLAAELRQLGGARFVLEAGDEIHRYGFCDGEWPMLAALREGANLPELEAKYRDLDPRAMQAAIYALVACGTARVIVVTRAPTPISLPRTKTAPELAAEAAERAHRALANSQPLAAVLEMKKAVALVPNDVDYSALLGWALFCATEDKPGIAGETRKLLERALHDSPRPQIARYYLGRVERTLGHDHEALQHFYAVLMLEPDHRDASAEIRALQERLSRN